VRLSPAHQLVPVSPRSLARACWEDAANWKGDAAGAAIASTVYAAKVAGTDLEDQLVRRARKLLARAADLDARPPARAPGPAPDPVPESTDPLALFAPPSDPGGPPP